MNKVIIGLAFALVASTAFGGALLDPVMEQQVIVEETASAGFNHGVIPPLFFLFMVGVPLLLL